MAPNQQFALSTPSVLVSTTVSPYVRSFSLYQVSRRRCKAHRVVTKSVLSVLTHGTTLLSQYAFKQLSTIQLTNNLGIQSAMGVRPPDPTCSGRGLAASSIPTMTNLHIWRCHIIERGGADACIRSSRRHPDGVGILLFPSPNRLDNLRALASQIITIKMRDEAAARLPITHLHLARSTSMTPATDNSSLTRMGQLAELVTPLRSQIVTGKDS